MSRYIDADMLINAFISKLDDEETMFNQIARIFIRLLRDSPSIDIVRCKECKWAEPTNDGWNSVTCNFYGETTLTMPTDGFCNYGERKNNAD